MANVAPCPLEAEVIPTHEAVGLSASGESARGKVMATHLDRARGPRLHAHIALISWPVPG